MSSICTGVTGGVRCERIAFTEIEGRKLCWQCSLLFRHEEYSRTTRDLGSDMLNRPDVTLPTDIRKRLKTLVGQLSYLLEHSPI